MLVDVVLDFVSFFSVSRSSTFAQKLIKMHVLLLCVSSGDQDVQTHDDITLKKIV